jgi:ABC-type bacteriocin/lantibiotic exporter with double-glycine peptidase domain
MILDEITSALDEPAAASILQGLDLFRKARTLIIISHRPATML